MNNFNLLLLSLLTAYFMEFVKQDLRISTALILFKNQILQALLCLNGSLILTFLLFSTKRLTEVSFLRNMTYIMNPTLKNASLASIFRVHMSVFFKLEI